MGRWLWAIKIPSMYCRHLKNFDLQGLDGITWVLFCWTPLQIWHGPKTSHFRQDFLELAHEGFNLIKWWTNLNVWYCECEYVDCCLPLRLTNPCTWPFLGCYQSSSNPLESWKKASHLTKQESLQEHMDGMQTFKGLQLTSYVCFGVRSSCSDSRLHRIKNCRPHVWCFFWVSGEAHKTSTSPMFSEFKANCLLDPHLVEAIGTCIR